MFLNKSNFRVIKFYYNMMRYLDLNHIIQLDVEYFWEKNDRKIGFLLSRLCGKRWFKCRMASIKNNNRWKSKIYEFCFRIWNKKKSKLALRRITINFENTKINCWNFRLY